MAIRHFPPPALAERLAARALDEEERAARLGDLEERFQVLARERGERRARIWYRWQVLSLVILAFINRTQWSCIMFRNNFIIAWRSIKRSKAYSALNVLGLAVGLAVFILIMLYVRYELSYDRYHAKAKDIYRVILQRPGTEFLGSNISAVTPVPLAPALAQDFPEVLAATRIAVLSNILLKVGEKAFFSNSIHWADPQMFEIFSFPFVRGEGATALKSPFSVLLSERQAQRLFGDVDPIGQTVLWRGNIPFRVDGVFRDIPANSHFRMDFVAPLETFFKHINTDDTQVQWSHQSVYTYVLLKEETDARILESKLPPFIDKHAGKEILIPGSEKPRFSLQPLTRVHLTAGINSENAMTTDARFVFLMATIAVLVLMIACINYMNLAAARSLKRTKEVGLRKVVGAAKGQIVRQFLGDSLMITFFALLLAVGAVVLLLPAFRIFVERDVVFSPIRDIGLLAGLAVLALAVGTISGSYPAFLVSAFKPVSALKGSGLSKLRGRGLRNGLIVFQFAASISLIICTLGVKNQIRYIRNKDMGYERDQILVLPILGGIRANLEAFKTEVKRHPEVLGLSVSSSLPNQIANKTLAHWPGKPDSVEVPMYLLFADHDYIDLFGLKICQGRNFSREFPSDANGAYLLNEAARKALGWTNPVGRDFGRARKAWPALGKIVGVVKDFHLHSLHLPIAPLYIVLDPKNTAASLMSIKLRGQDIRSTLGFIRETWKRFEPIYPFEYSFFDDIFDRAYRAEQRLEKIFSAFAGLAVLIACLGLLGLAAFTAEQKTKEIGIRKVLGASTAGVIALLSRDFMKWVVAANVVAWPVGYFAMRSWLSNFAYRIDLTVPMFLGAALAAFAIAAAVISLQTYRAAAANPADSMRYE